MARSSIAAALLVLALPWGGGTGSAQDIDDLNLQIHGYATQGFVYSTHNNWDTTDSTDGSAAWTEAVVNITVRPESKLRIGVQGRFFLLGNYGNAITLDWAEADYKFNEHIGFRVGKVKTPTGLLNEIQDIGPGYLWVILPQSIYPLASRNTILAHYGGVVYGSLPLGEKMGKLEYRGYGGVRIVASDDGSLAQFEVAGLTIPEGLSGTAYGGTLRWYPPVAGLELGATEGSERQSGAVTDGSLQGQIVTSPFTVPYFFGQYEQKKIMVAAEYNRVAPQGSITFNGYAPIYMAEDRREFYVMASYKIAKKLTGGLYYSSAIDRKVPTSSARFQKDWALSVRYDLDPYLYLKAEQHFVDGTELGYSASDNADGLSPNTRMTLLKFGVSF